MVNQIAPVDGQEWIAIACPAYPGRDVDQRMRLPLSLALVLAMAAAAPALGATVSDTQSVAEGLSAADVFRLADQARANGRIDDAERFYEALAGDPDADIRAEARFRKGQMMASAGRYREAAVAYRALLDEKPDATPVRLELARVLAALGDESAARRELRQARTAGLPPDVAVIVDQFSNALRSSKPLGGSLELAFAPDSNINRATAVRTLDTIVAPLTLSDDARQQSGLGARVATQGYARLPVADTLSLVPRLSGRGDIYRQSQFNDISGSALIGLEWRSGRDRLNPSIGQTWRWYGGDLYARTRSLAVDWIHPMGSKAQLTMQGSAAQARYRRNPLQNGGLYSGTLTYERALGAQSGAALTINATRQTARDPGYATRAGGLTLLGWRSLGRTTLFLSAGAQRLVGDERLFLFPEKRREWLYQVNGGITFRQLRVNSFAPVLRIGYERNRSSVELYDYRRLSAQIGVTRAF